MNDKQAIFKAYDIRGIVNTELDKKTVEQIGMAIGTKSIKAGQRDIVIARDGRLSSPQLRNYLIAGLKKSGCHIMDIGVCPTPVLYFATKTTTATTGVMITGSHNPPQYNGFKIVIAGNTLAGDGIQELYQTIISNDYQQGSGSSSQIDISDNYLQAIYNTIKLKKPLTIVIDCGNGASSIIAPKLYKSLGAKVLELYCSIDGNFPNHHPNPSDEASLTDLKKAVLLNNADFGIAFDGDGDRLGLIDNKGNIIRADRQLMLYAKEVLKHNDNANIVFDVKCSNVLPEIIKKHGGNAIMCRTGHSFIKAKMQQTKAKLAGEMSGHIFFNDRWFGFDDALYTGARLLEILSNSNKTCAQIFNELPNTINTPEINIDFDKQGEQFMAMEKLIKNIPFEEKYINDIDGIRIDLPNNSWGLVRPSNTTACLVLRFEANNKQDLIKIQDKFKNWLIKAGIIKSKGLCPFDF